MSSNYTGEYRIKSLTGTKWFQFTNLIVYKTADEDKVELSFKDSNGKIITATIIRIITNDIISQRRLSLSSVTGNARDNRINIYVETQSDPYSFSISKKIDYDSFVSKLENLLERVKQDAKDQSDYQVYESNTKDDHIYTFKEWKKNKDDENKILYDKYFNRTMGGRKTRKRKAHPSTKKHKKNKKHKKRASTKKHKKYKKKRPRTRKR